MTSAPERLYCQSLISVITKPLEPPDSHHLSAAQGWIELGNPREAVDDLARISPGFAAHPDVLEVRWHIHASLKQWDVCLDSANAIINLDPRRPNAWIHRSFALHELKQTRQAFEELLPAAGIFPGIWTIPYNLACYQAQLGLLSESAEWLKKAMAIDKRAVREAARNDPDLKSLRESPASPF